LLGLLHINLPVYNVCLRNFSIQYSERHIRSIRTLHFYAAASVVPRWRESTCHTLRVQAQDKATLAITQALTSPNK